MRTHLHEVAVLRSGRDTRWQRRDLRSVQVVLQTWPSRVFCASRQNEELKTQHRALRCGEEAILFVSFSLHTYMIVVDQEPLNALNGLLILLLLAQQTQSTERRRFHHHTLLARIYFSSFAWITTRDGVLATAKPPLFSHSLRYNRIDLRHLVLLVKVVQ